MLSEDDYNPTEMMLLQNTSWPYKVNGTFESVDGGHVGDSGYTTWITGALYLRDSEDSLSIMIEESALKDAQIKEDDLEDVELSFWLAEPKKEGDLLIFDVAKLSN